MHITRKLIIILSITYASCLNASSFEKKEVIFKSIEVECKDINSKYYKYNEIGMKQFARNYFKLCLEEKINRFIKVNYEKCIKADNEKNCQRKIKLWLEN